MIDLTDPQGRRIPPPPPVRECRIASPEEVQGSSIKLKPTDLINPGPAREVHPQQRPITMVVRPIGGSYGSRGPRGKRS